AEARPDLCALWNICDPKTRELGLIDNQEEVARAMYDSSAQIASTQLRTIPEGNTIDEDHARDRHLAVNDIIDKACGNQRRNLGEKTYIGVADWNRMRQGVGMLLAELMRIKAEGDFDAIKALIDKYGVHFDPAIRDQVIARYKSLNLPTYWAGINVAVTAQI